jgi:hypothetical protein
VVRSPPVGVLPSLSAVVVLVICFGLLLFTCFLRFVSFGVAVYSHRSIDVPPPRPRFAVL